MASNPEDFLAPAADVLGVSVRIISGDEEGALAYGSVAHDSVEEELRVLDIGGGSTELVVGRGGQVIQRRSHPVGSVRSHERWLRSDPPTKHELQQLETEAAAAFSSQPLAPYPRLYGLAGTVTSAAALVLGLSEYDRGRVDGARISLDAVESLRDAMACRSIAERVAIPILGKGRGDVIVAGLGILAVAMRHCGADTLVVRDRGIRFGLI